MNINDKSIRKQQFIESVRELAEKHKTEQDYDSMKKYYRMAIGQGDVQSMISLADYYEYHSYYYGYTNPYEDTRSESLMVLYRLMAIDKGCTISMCKLAKYKNSICESEDMKKYYLMAIDKGCVEAMYGLAKYYKEMEDYDMMERYYLMASENGCVKSMYKLSNYYCDICDLKLMEKYCLMAVEKGCAKALKSLESYYICTLTDYNFFTCDIKPEEIYPILVFFYKYLKLSDAFEYYNVQILNDDIIQFISDLDLSKTGLPDNHIFHVLHRALKAKIDLTDLHFNYAPDSTSFMEAKSDFCNKLLKAY